MCRSRVEKKRKQENQPRTNSVTYQAGHKLVEIFENKILIIPDTGSAVTIFNLETLKQFRLENYIEPTKKVFLDCGNNRIRPLGRIFTPIRYKGKCCEEEMFVVEEGSNIIDREACELLGMVTMNKINSLRTINGYSYNIMLKPNVKPIVQRERPIPFCIRPQVEAELNRLLNEGILVKSTQTDWASPIVVVRKKNGEIRLCGDFRKLNLCIRDDKYYIPNIEDLMAKLGESSKCFAKIDLKSAYHQIALDDESQLLTTIVTHMGTFKYTRMPFGVESAPSAFQRIINQIIGNREGVICYLDDILVAAHNETKLKTRVTSLLKTLETCNISINEEKSILSSRKIEWLGYEISRQGIRATGEKTDYISKIKVPTCTKEVRQTLGIINYYAKFVPNLAKIASPLYNLLQKNRKFKWGSNEDDALKQIKNIIKERKILKPFNTSLKRKVILKTDAYDEGMGAVLKQEQEDGKSGQSFIGLPSSASMNKTTVSLKKRLL